MREIILVPIAAIIVLGLMSQLAEIAMSTSEKTLNYAGEMDNAIDCAFRALPIAVCSPGLTNEDFVPEVSEAIDFNQRLIDEYNIDVESLINESNYTNTTIILLQ